MEHTNPTADPINATSDAPASLDDATQTEVAALARRQADAQGVLLRLVSLIGEQVEDGMRFLPKPARRQLNKIASRALKQSYYLAERSRGEGLIQRTLTTDRAHRVAATMTGALGGIGGLATAAIEIPVATTVIFRAVQNVAASYGEDPQSEETRLQCLAVFGAGAPEHLEEGVDTAFIGARLSMSGAAVKGLISRVAPRFVTLLGQKVASQAVPILGAAAGASTNYAFVGYYTEVAHVHFGLRQLARIHGERAVLEQFHAELDRMGKPVLKA